MGRGGIRLVWGAILRGRSYESSCQDHTSAGRRPLGRAGGAGHRAVALVRLLGCTYLQPRLQSDDDGADYPIETIRNKAAVGNAIPIPVGGVGLVVDLEGTGGDCPAGSYRSILENDFARKTFKYHRRLLSSPNTRWFSCRPDPAGRRQGRAHRFRSVASARQPGNQFTRRLSP